MPISRYKNNQIINIPDATLATNESISNIRSAYSAGLIQCNEIISKSGQRLDHFAGLYLGDARYWWIIAAVSNIGWPLQIAPGTKILIPKDINVVLRYL